MQKKSTVNDLLTSIKHLEKTFSRYTSKPIVGQPLYELIIAEIDKQAEVDVPLTDDEVEVVGHGGGGSNVSDSNRKNNVRIMMSAVNENMQMSTIRTASKRLELNI